MFNLFFSCVFSVTPIVVVVPFVRAFVIWIYLVSFPNSILKTFVPDITTLVFVSELPPRRMVYDIYHNPCFCVTRSRNISYTLFLSETKTRVMVYSSNVSHKNKVYDIFLERVTQKQGLWYIPRMSQTKTRGMIYSSNVSHNNKGYEGSISYPRFLSETFEEYTITLDFV
jgi:hypothetical protein